MATFYLDFDNGDNTRTSTEAQNPATPWKHMRDFPGVSGNAFTYVPVAGDTFLLARGSIWTNTTWVKFARLGTISAPFTFGAYDRPGETGGNKPIISNLFPLTSWTLDTGTRWYATTAASQTHAIRLFINKEPKGQASSAVNVDRSDENFYFYDSTTGRIYIDSGSTVNDPSDVYGTIETTRSDGGYITAFYIRNEAANPASYINVSDIEFHGGGTLTVSATNHSDATTTLSNVNFTNCDVKYFSQTAFNVQSYKTDQLVDGVTFTNCDATTDWALCENKGVSGNGDGFLIGNNTNNVKVIDCSAHGTRHSGASIVSTNLNYTLGCNNHLIDGFNYTNSIGDYGRGFSVSGEEGLVSDCTVRSSVFDGGCVQNQVDGIRIKVYGNVVKNIRNSIVSTLNHGIAFATSNFPGPTDAYNIEDCEIHNNLIMNNAGAGLYLLAKDQENMLSNKFYNNIIVNNGAYAGAAGHTNYDQIVVDAQSSSTTIGLQDFQNNIIYSNQKSDTISWQNDFSVAAVQHTVTSANALSDFTNNLSTDPAVSTDYSTHVGYKAGKTIAFNRKDIKGHKFKTPPTIGAYEFTSGSAALDRTQVT